MFSVGLFEVNPSQNTLSHKGQLYGVEPLVMDVLVHLANRPSEVVSRDELINQVWLFNPGADESLTRAISLLRRIFRIDKSIENYIETVWKRGYTLAAPVDFQAAANDRGPTATRLLDQLPAASDYSVAVLGFENMSTRESDRYLADGLTRDLTSLLGRVPRLHVAAYNSATRLQGAPASIAEIAGKLGVRYLVSGTLTREGDGLSVRHSLMDSVTDEQVWASKMSVDLANFYEVEDTIVLDISTAMSSALQLSHANSPKQNRSFQLGAYELVQQAEALRLNYNEKAAFEIIALLEQALEINPDDAAVHAALAVQYTQNIVSNFAGTPADAAQRAGRYLDAAMRLAPLDPEVLAAAGIVATMRGNPRLAVRNLTRSVELNPNNPHSLAVLGWQYCWLNSDVAGQRMIETAEARAPHHPRFGLWAHYRGHCEIKLGRIDQAIAAYDDCADRNPNYSLNLVALAMAQALAGRANDARGTVKRLLMLAPHYTVADYQQLVSTMAYWFADRTTRDRSISALHEVWPRPAPARAAG